MSNITISNPNIIEFFEKNDNKINLDGLFGIRIAEGVFVKLENTYFSNIKLQFAIKTIRNRLHLLGDLIEFNLSLIV